MSGMGPSLETDVKLEETEPRRVVQLFEEFATENGVPAPLVMKFELALDEVLTNVVSYAFPENAPENAEDPAVKVTMRVDGDWVKVRVQDNGPAFDPLHDAQEPDVTLDAEDRPIGGLGIFLARSFVHTLTYERVDGCNRLTLAQPLETPPENASP